VAAKQVLELATRHEVPKARANYEAANADWRRIPSEVFDRVMACFGLRLDHVKVVAPSSDPWRQAIARVDLNELTE
jgi:hypothetical protein